MAPLRERIARLRAWWEGLSARERRMLGTLAGVFSGIFVLLVGFFIWSGLSERADHNQAVRDVLREIAQHREEFVEARRRMASQEVRVSRTPVQLSSLLEAAAKAEGVQI